ncbi:MAG: hypothetical protein ACYDCL_10015 [Myxococcales bacterium]
MSEALGRQAKKAVLASELPAYSVSPTGVVTLEGGSPTPAADSANAGNGANGATKPSGS